MRMEMSALKIQKNWKSYRARKLLNVMILKLLVINTLIIITF